MKSKSKIDLKLANLETEARLRPEHVNGAENGVGRKSGERKRSGERRSQKMKER